MTLEERISALEASVAERADHHAVVAAVTSIQDELASLSGQITAQAGVIEGMQVQMSVLETRMNQLPRG